MLLLFVTSSFKRQLDYTVFTINCFSLFKEINEDYSVSVPKTVTITLPADGIVFSFFGVGSPFAGSGLVFFYCCLVSEVLWQTQSSLKITHQYKNLVGLHLLRAKQLLSTSFSVRVCKHNTHLVHSFLVHKCPCKIMHTHSINMPIVC